MNFDGLRKVFSQYSVKSVEKYRQYIRHNNSNSPSIMAGTFGYRSFNSLLIKICISTMKQLGMHP
ncbi:hypothetical protein FRX31_025819 [Thalictrum thalictroides]|uniref:Uncharacterized protein n=1 Tax=Thalictrum thalictroides TaxID=46969 RepID=A0A7J6VHL6_THATH|nr:hypothetical protein FRX31_025819 [Thalictrum thalictroides]